MRFSRWIVWGTFGQTALLVSSALLVAQVLGFFLIANERDRWRLLDAVDPAIAHFVSAAQRIAQAPAVSRQQMVSAYDRPDEHFVVSDKNALQVLGLGRQPDLQQRLAKGLAASGIAGPAIASSIGFSDSPQGGRAHTRDALEHSIHFFMPHLPQPAFMVRPPGFPPADSADMPMPPGTGEQLYFAVQLHDGAWINGQFLFFAPPSGLLGRLATAEILLFAIVLGVTLVLAMRLARPMAQLAAASETIGPDLAPVLVPERGPADIREAIRAFNLMSARVAALLREKDHTLGALGHDLRTPLASLRIRAESIEPEAEREKIVEIVSDMTRMIDEILALARLGHSQEPFELVDVAALADSVVEEFKDLGKQVEFADSRRTVLRIQTSLVRRLLRNLIENAIKYGTQASVSLEEDRGALSLVVRDNGPGIPEADIPRMLEPFVRLEASRNRETGGTGIGLSIANRLARSQGAKLILANNANGGLVARVVWAKNSERRIGRPHNHLRALLGIETGS